MLIYVQQVLTIFHTVFLFGKVIWICQTAGNFQLGNTDNDEIVFMGSILDSF